VREEAAAEFRVTSPRVPPACLGREKEHRMGGIHPVNNPCSTFAPCARCIVTEMSLTRVSLLY